MNSTDRAHSTLFSQHYQRILKFNTGYYLLYLDNDNDNDNEKYLFDHKSTKSNI